MPDNILDRLPHEGAARLPEEILLFEPGRRVIARRRLAGSGGLLNPAGHLPSVLLVEMMAQVGGLLVEDPDDGSSQYGLLAGVKRMHLHATAVAGETVTVDCSLVRRMGDLYLIRCEGTIGDRPAAHGSVHIRRVRKEAP
jgi:predicted hotdog family 3-hydroxylacyl-ACP dehydratase